MKEDKQYIEETEQALRDNIRCVGGVLAGRRVFIRVQNGKKEMLCLVYYDAIPPVNIWGHIFYFEGKYITVLLPVLVRINASTEELLFERVWWAISQREFYVPDYVSEEDVLAISGTFEGAVDRLKSMVAHFDILGPDIYNPALRIMDVYSFCFDKKKPYPGKVIAYLHKSGSPVIEKAKEGN